MFFKPIIKTWRGADPSTDDGLVQLAADLGLPTKNVRRWADLDSIPADWFSAIARAAAAAGFEGVTEASLSAVAERRRMTRRAA